MTRELDQVNWRLCASSPDLGMHVLPSMPMLVAILRTHHDNYIMTHRYNSWREESAVETTWTDYMIESSEGIYTHF